MGLQTQASFFNKGYSSLRLFVRRYSSQRIPNYSGWWSLILQKSLVRPQEQIVQWIPPTTENPYLHVNSTIGSKTVPRQTILLKETLIELPQKPESPDNCCMSGCAHW
ncbi:hypothetical protein BDF14DRAFT_1732566 [Spinellus fusiger]|nr:hypothetical protein BDF14DRAFT_1732566 [Spinellus fusiger]